MAEVPRGLMQPIINGIVPVGNIPLQELPEHYNLLVEQNKLVTEQLLAISEMFNLSIAQNAALQEGLKNSAKVDVEYVNGVKGVNEALSKENAHLKKEITHLQNQKTEIAKVGEENVKSLQEQVTAIEQLNEMHVENAAMQEKTIKNLETTQAANEAILLAQETERRNQLAFQMWFHQIARAPFR